MSVSRRASFAAGIAAVRRQKKTKMSSNRDHLGEVAEGEKTDWDDKIFSVKLSIYSTQNCPLFSETVNHGIIYIEV